MGIPAPKLPSQAHSHTASQETLADSLASPQLTVLGKFPCMYRISRLSLGFELWSYHHPWVADDPHVRKKTLALLRLGLVSLPFHGHTGCVKPLSQEGSEIFDSSIISFLFLVFLSCLDPSHLSVLFFSFLTGVQWHRQWSPIGIECRARSREGKTAASASARTLRRHAAPRHRCRLPLPLPTVGMYFD